MVSERFDVRFLLNDAVARAQGVEDPAARARIAVTGAVFRGPISLATALVLARREAEAAAPPPTPAVPVPVPTPAPTPLPPRYAQVPDVVGQPSFDDAQALLQKEGFKGTEEPVESPQTLGEVVGQDPAAGAFEPRGMSVKVFTSAGIQVPDVRKKSQGEAMEILRGEGFGAKVEPRAGGRFGQVVDQDPKPGVYAQQGSEVTIFVTPPSHRPGQSSG